MATKVQSKTEPVTAPRQKSGTWSFGLLTATRPWPFVEREKPAILLGGQDEPDLSYMCGGADDEGELLYGMALMASGPTAFKHKPSVGDDSVTVFVKSGPSGHNFVRDISCACEQQQGTIPSMYAVCNVDCIVRHIKQ